MSTGALFHDRSAGTRTDSSPLGILAWQDVYDILHDLGIQNVPGKDTYGAGKTKSPLPRVANERSLELFPGFKYRGLKETVTDMTTDLVKAGLLSQSRA